MAVIQPFEYFVIFYETIGLRASLSATDAESQQVKN